MCNSFHEYSRVIILIYGNAKRFINWTRKPPKPIRLPRSKTATPPGAKRFARR